MKNTVHKFNNLSRNKKAGISAVAAAVLAGGLVIGCGGGDSTTTTFTPLTTEPVIAGTDLFCSGVIEVNSSVADDFNASQVIAYNVSGKDKDGNEDTTARQNPNAANTLVRMGTITISPLTAGGADANGTTKEAKVHPLIISYAEQVFGDYQLGDGSADVGDPTHWDDIFVSLSRDDGKTWKKYPISDNAGKDRSSIKVTWNGQQIDYPAHAVKPTMVASGNKILVAWHSKYCPSGNPLDLNKSADSNTTYPTDYFQVNGSQGSIDYEGIVFEPNGKTVWEVPFSCIWTARGIMDTTTGDINWMQPQQLTSGTRDAAKVTIAEAVPGAGSEAGFAITWQEDPEGLRSGKGEGPGDGWSGATTNHGADIWYSMIMMDDFVKMVDENVSKPVPAVNFSYPVRITDNEGCKVDDTKLYCQAMCDTYGSATTTTSKGQTVQRCKSGDVDMLTGTQVILDGDTGASRPLIKLLKSNATDEYVVVLGYEETKGLSDEKTSTTDTVIALEGKSVYYESFPFKKVVAPTNETEFKSLISSLPMVSSGNIINVKVKDQNSTDMIYENARRLTFVPQIDPCDTGKYTYGWLYKQGTETQGGSSDMYVRMNTTFKYDTLEAPVNVSSNAYMDENGTSSTWTTANLSDASYTNLAENSFSPRGFMRGDDIYIGFEYTPDYHPDSGYSPNNFYIHRYTNGAWQGPQNISKVYGNHLSTLDPRFVTTPKGKYSITGLESDKANPNVLFMSFGTFNTSTGIEEDLFYTRSTDKGVTWEVVGTSGVTPNAGLATKQDIEEKEVQSLATPDGTRLFNAWLQESATFDLNNHFSGLDTWFGMIDYNIPVTPID